MVYGTEAPKSGEKIDAAELDVSPGVDQRTEAPKPEEQINTAELDVWPDAAQVTEAPKSGEQIDAKIDITPDVDWVAWARRSEKQMKVTESENSSDTESEDSPDKDWRTEAPESGKQVNVAKLDVSHVASQYLLVIACSPWETRLGVKTISPEASLPQKEKEQMLIDGLIDYVNTKIEFRSPGPKMDLYGSGMYDGILSVAWVVSSEKLVGLDTMTDVRLHFIEDNKAGSNWKCAHTKPMGGDFIVPPGIDYPDDQTPYIDYLDHQTPEIDNADDQRSDIDYLDDQTPEIDYPGTMSHKHQHSMGYMSCGVVRRK